MSNEEAREMITEVLNAVGPERLLKALINQAQDEEDQLYAIRLEDALITLQNRD
jgi:hypothetical protein